MSGQTKPFLNFDISKLPPCQSLNYLFTNISTPPAGKPFQPGSFSWNFGDGTTVTRLQAPSCMLMLHPEPTMVQLILSDTNYCNYPDTTTQTLRVSPVVKAQFEIGDGCAPYNAFFNNTSLAGQQFFLEFWRRSEHLPILIPCTLIPIREHILYRCWLIDSNTCNMRDSTTHTIHVNPKPIAGFTTQAGTGSI